jgi:hypothetical protein
MPITCRSNARCVIRTLALLGLLACQGCTMPKPPPGWPDGEPRPINLPHAKATR